MSVRCGKITEHRPRLNVLRGPNLSRVAHGKAKGAVPITTGDVLGPPFGCRKQSDQFVNLNV